MVFIPLSRLEENIGAAAIQLTADDLHEIESAASKIDRARRAISGRTAANDRSVNNATAFK